MAILAAVTVLVAVAVVLLAVKIILVKGGRFPHTHIHGTNALNERGITCARAELDTAVDDSDGTGKLTETHNL